MMMLFWKVLFVASWLAAFLVLSQAEDPGEERYLQVRSSTIAAKMSIDCHAGKIMEHVCLT